jgi:hypothetical protein
MRRGERQLGDQMDAALKRNGKHCGQAERRMARAYWRRVGQLALQDTLRALSLDSVERAVLRIIAAVIGVVIVHGASREFAITRS